MSEDLTPVAIEARLVSLITATTQAQTDLRAFRRAEVDAEVAYKRAKLAASFDGNCPKVTRGGYTVADRDAWIELQCIDQWEAYRRATVAREIEVDHLRVLAIEHESTRSLGASVRTSLSLAGAA
jgi:hypothetical protein